MYQDEAGFGRISKLGSCWSPIGVGPHVHSHYIREFRYCYGAVDAHIGRCHESTPRCHTRTGEGGDKVHC